MMKKLTKGIEDSKKEKERLTEEKEKLNENIKEIKQKTSAVEENYKKTQEVLFLVLLLVWLCKLCAYISGGGGDCTFMYCVHYYVDD